jgi:hypothetical protein
MRYEPRDPFPLMDLVILGFCVLGIYWIGTVGHWW